ncbi:cupin domain-containing protein [Fibrella forsythiae]|uniref:Cupin domain-containing protein n=1 Tax=Fibrella forsythiae TaxID=2817061 RepID=A0ABS3JLW1_9BACT|nr:cupin domain-containing protein [Fibrella forsythiae]MBO0949892.1 cupin domain-containing protein [Fibrella forsythiae]
MPRLLVVLLFLLPAIPLLAQPIASTVYAWKDAPVVKKPGTEQRKMLEGSATDFKHIEVHTTTVAAHQAPHPAHKHDDEELIIIKEGELTVTIAGKTTTLGPNSIALIMPGDEHGFENKGNIPATYYVMRYESKTPADAERGQKAGGSLMIDWKEVPFQPHDKGGIRRMFDRATAMTKRFEMHVTTLNNGLASHPPHTHRAAEILIMVNNAAESSVDGKLIPNTTGDLTYLESNVPHNITNNTQKPCTYFAFQFE